MAVTLVTASPPGENVDPWFGPRNTFDQQVKATANEAGTTADAAVSAAAAAQTTANGKAPLVHTHDAGAITSGTFVLARIPDVTQAKVIGLVEDLAEKADLVGGIIPTSQLPPIAISEFLGSVNSQAAMLALSGQRGDWAIRTDVSSLAILTGEPSSSLANWQLIEIGAGAAGVSSVNEQSGIVVLGYSDVGAASAAQGALAATALQPGDVGTAAFEDVAAFATAAQGALAETAVQPGDLGTAASQPSSAFATAAQGAKADSAVQPAALDAKANALSAGIGIWAGPQATFDGMATPRPAGVYFTS